MRAGISIGFSLVATLLVLCSLDAPGLTIDEPINTGHGKRMVYAVSHEVGKAPAEKIIDSLYRTGHEHPPLARFLIGLAHAWVDPDPQNPDVIDPMGGRSASAVALGVTVGLAAWEAGRWAGVAGAIWGGLWTLLLPRFFGHGHLASPEVISTAFIFASLVACRHLIDHWIARRRIVVSIVIAGVAVAIAMLTKLTAVTVPLTLSIALVLAMGWRGVIPLLAVGMVSLGCLVAGWPWLWPIDLDGYAAGWLGTSERLSEFFRVGIDRATIYVDYFGTQYPHDGVSVPVSFVWFFFITTTPVVTLIMGSIGWAKLLHDRRTAMSAFVWVVFPCVVLFLFSLPIARYDSERLFLFLFPVWSMLAGVGSARKFAWPAMTTVCRVVSLLGVGLTVRSMVLLHPLTISYFNELVGGLPGAEKRKVELTYWGDSLTRDFLDEWATLAKAGDRAVLLPTLYEGHPLLMMTPAMKRKNLSIIAPAAGRTDAEWAIVFRRSGYLHDELSKKLIEAGRPVAELTRDGVWLTRLYRLLPER
jgi:hypothetical protein